LSVFGLDYYLIDLRGAPIHAGIWKNLPGDSAWEKSGEIALVQLYLRHLLKYLHTSTQKR